MDKIYYSQFQSTCSSNKTVIIKHDTCILKLFLTAAKKTVSLFRNKKLYYTLASIFLTTWENLHQKIKKWIVFPESYVNLNPARMNLVKLSLPLKNCMVSTISTWKILNYKVKTCEICNINQNKKFDTYIRASRIRNLGTCFSVYLITCLCTRSCTSDFVHLK